MIMAHGGLIINYILMEMVDYSAFSKIMADQVRLFSEGFIVLRELLTSSKV